MTTAPKSVKPINSVGLTPLVGGYYFSSSQSLDPAPTYGLRLSYDHVGKGIVDSIGIEATFNYLTTNIKNQDAKATAYLFRTDAVYSFNPRSKWVPYLVLGAGGIFIDREGVRDNSPLLNFGAGIKYFFDDYLAIRADLRQLMVYSNVDTTSDFELSTGLTYYFGKERKKKAPPPPPPKPRAPVPVIEEEPVAPPVAPEAPPVAAPPPNILELLGASGAAALGLNTLPPRFEPGAAPEVQPKVPAKAYKSTLKQMPKAAAPPKAIEAAPAPAPAPPKAIEAVPAPAPAPVQPPPAVQPVPVPVQPQPAAPEQEPARKPQRSIRTLTIEFLFSSPAVRPIYQAQLAAFAALMKANEESSALIEGHTDNVGDSRSNLKLSQQRAQNVRNELLKYGVAPAKVAIKGYGFSKPRASNRTNEGRQKNRRAVVTLTLVITQ